MAQAVSGLDFTVESGQICGLLGPNGAGKTSTMRMLVGLSSPDAGSAAELATQLLRIRTLIALACLAAVPALAGLATASDAGHRNGAETGLFGASPFSASAGIPSTSSTRPP